MPKCRLCKQEKELIKKSHIIPNFMYQNLFDEKHRLRNFDTAALKGEGGRIDKPQSGIHEGGLLCSDCDGGIIGNRYESYASKTIFGGELLTTEIPEIKKYKDPNGLEFSLISNIDYTRFKLFLLSILWRASISSKNFFQDINLGEKHEEIIRDMLYNVNPGDNDDYPIVPIFYLRDEKMPEAIIEPSRGKTKDGANIYTFVMAGAFFVYFVNSKNKKTPEYVHEITINLNNEFKFLHIPDGKEWTYLSRFLGL